jgi:bifunctional DNA-binding transcriptional regulator/antitoxin component of YhaV-PrlF toxin-antitoxin module
MAESTITAKGQTTVPLQIRESIGATPGHPAGVACDA